MDQPNSGPGNQTTSKSLQDALHVAVVGMAGRFPGSETLEKFWENLRDGVECIHPVSDKDLEGMGVPRATLRKKNFVKAAAVLENVDQFDARFFGYPPREAELMDPQHRIFLECSWEALEHAGYQPETYPGLIGVYAGTSLSSYLLYNVLPNLPDIHSEDNFEVMIGNDKDFLSTRVAYKLNLKGPAIDVQTGCSTSLVAIHLACQALLCYQCDMALAGGVSVQVPQRSGYYYAENGINSPDGHCRAFDAQAQGTIFGSGVGIVVLKRLSDALHDDDHIHAVIRGSAINNDGAQKVGYTAPSVEGQSSAILAAQMLANVAPETISYVECHGTGTSLGDPVEVLALSNAFRGDGKRKNFCALGAVKSSIGHLDAAAGVAGFIKTVLAMEHKLLPPNLHFASPNPQIDFDNSPFFVNSSLREWRNVSLPRRAGVSSFGIGGTNAHVVLEEAPPASLPEAGRSFQVLLLSAKTPAALDAATGRLLDHLRARPESALADVAYTLAVGRKAFDHRRIVLCSDAPDAIHALQASDPARIFTHQYCGPSRAVVFMFPGGGAQYAQMGLGLYEFEPIFHEQVDSCAEILQPLLGLDIRTFLYPADKDARAASSRMKEPLIGLPALFVTEYALAKLWMSWGILPQAFIGHSLGEYTAAALAGVFSLQDALALVVTRARLFGKLPPGAMAGVPLSPEEIERYLGDSLSLAAVNSESQCLVSGAQNAIEELIQRLTEQEIECRRLQIDVASHSHMVAPMMGEFGDFLRTLEMRPPRIAYISNVTGTWITQQEAISPDYWLRHLRQPVLFGPGVQELLADPNRLLLEVGPGHTLSTLAKMSSRKHEAISVLASMRHPYDKQSDVAFLLGTAGKLWMAGASIDWQKFYAKERRARVVLPAYPFERQRYWIAPSRSNHAGGVTLDKTDDVDQWFYLPSWKLLPLPFTENHALPHANEQTWLIFLDEEGLGSRLAEKLLDSQADVYFVRRGDRFECINEKSYVLNPESQEDYVSLAGRLEPGIKGRLNVIHLWNVTRDDFNAGRTFEEFQHLGMYGLVYFVKVTCNFSGPVSLWVISTNVHQVEAKDSLVPDKATLLSPCIVIPQEYENFSCWSIDVDLIPGQVEKTAGALLAEIGACTRNRVVALRGGRRWVRSFEPVHMGEENVSRYLRKNGVYVITGGLGGIGAQIAGFLAEIEGARLALIERSVLLPEEEWDRWLLDHPEDDVVSVKIRKVKELLARGAEVIVLSADVANKEEMRAAMQQVLARWSEVDGIIHTAGVAGETAMQLIPDLQESTYERHFHAKVRGSRTIAEILDDVRPEFCLLFSSNAALLGGLGSIAYSAASIFMDAFAESMISKSSTRWISADWDPWFTRDDERIHATFDTGLRKHALNADESRETFRRVIASALPGRVVISTGNLPLRLEFWTEGGAASQPAGEQEDRPEHALHARPALSTTYVPPRSELENTVLKIWQQMIGIERLGVHDNFFDLGGNSLIGMRMINALKKTLQIELPIMALFEGPTVSALCQRIEQRQSLTLDFDESQDRGERRRLTVAGQDEFQTQYQNTTA